MQRVVQKRGNPHVPLSRQHGPSRLVSAYNKNYARRKEEEEGEPEETRQPQWHKAMLSCATLQYF